MEFFVCSKNTVFRANMRMMNLVKQEPRLDSILEEAKTWKYERHPLSLGLGYAICINDEHGSFRRRLSEMMSMFHSVKHAFKLPHLTYGNLANPSLFFLIHRIAQTQWLSIGKDPERDVLVLTQIQSIWATSFWEQNHKKIGVIRLIEYI